MVSCGALAWLAQVFAGCGQTVPVGVDDPLPSSGSGSGSGSLSGAGGALNVGGEAPTPVGGSAASGGEAPCQPTECRGKLYECGNCTDDDEDGRTDALDPACLGPCDDDETGLSTGLSSTSAACQRDCYFDGDAGPGNDGCEWSHQCDPLSVAPSYPPSGDMRCAYDPLAGGLDCEELRQEQPAACVEACLPVAPNGCDCFGCCELPGGSGNFHYVGVGRGSAGCQPDALNDPQACPPCTPVEGCFNDCKPCEACVGRAPEASCQAGNSCEPGQQRCGADAPCGLGFYCITGCCVRAPVR
jgi:hypothetical protein